MTDDLIARLLDTAVIRADDIREAADRIAALEAELAAARSGRVTVKPLEWVGSGGSYVATDDLFNVVAMSGDPSAYDAKRSARILAAVTLSPPPVDDSAGGDPVANPDPLGAEWMRQEAGRVTVKPLEWRQSRPRFVVSDALGVSGFYRIFGGQGDWTLQYLDGPALRVLEGFETQAAAKAAAQADYEARILAAVTLSPPPANDSGGSAPVANAARGAIDPIRRPDSDWADFIWSALNEADKAMRKFPQPNYVITKVAEEAGEVVKAAVHCAEGRETTANVRGEMRQLIAMLYRLWVEGDQVHGLPALRALSEGKA